MSEDSSFGGGGNIDPSTFAHAAGEDLFWDRDLGLEGDGISGMEQENAQCKRKQRICS